MPDRVCDSERRVGRGQSQDIVPTFERDEHQHRRRQESLEHRHLFNMRIDVRDQSRRGFLRFVERPFHTGRVSQKMEIVAVIHE